MRNILTLGVCFLALLIPAACLGQSGVVKSDGLPIPGATVKATQGERILLTVTDANGDFKIDGMGAGTWIVEVDMFGFDHARKEVQIGQTPAKIDFTLQLRDRTRQAGGGRGGNNNSEEAGADLGGAQIGAQINSGLPDMPQPQVGAEASNESLLVTGSVSQGAQTTGADFGPGFPGGPGGFPGGPGGNLQAGGPGGPGGGPRGAGGGGFGGGGGRGGGGGGFAGGGGGGRNGGGRGGRGGGRGNPAFIGNRQRAQQNRINGSLFYQLGNSVLNARPFSVDGLVAPKAAYSQNRFGFSAGGPLFIPKLFSLPKVFWFVNYAGNLLRNGVDLASSEPTLAERSGNFSQLLTGSRPTIIYNPTNGQPFQGNVIPPTMISSIAQGLLQYIPTPNQAVNSTNQDFRLIAANPNNSQSLNTRFNTTLAPRDTLAVTYNFQERNSATYQTFGCCDNVLGYGNNANINWRHRFGARNFNSVTLSFNRNTTAITPFFANGTNVAAGLGIQGTSPNPIDYGPPALQFTNFSTLNDSTPTTSAIWSYGVGDTFQYRKGKHNWSFGGGYNHYFNNTTTDANGRGTFEFSGLSTAGYTSGGLPISGTGYDFADFLLGLPETSTIRYGNSSTSFRSTGYNAFVSDDYRLATGLSLNLGLRYDYFSPWSEEHGNIANLDIAPNFGSVTPVCAVLVTLATGGTCGPTVDGLTYPGALIQSDKHNFSPRIAIAWKPRSKGLLSKTLVRAGYGWAVNPSQFNRFESQLAAEPPFAVTHNVTTSTADVLTLATGLANLPAAQSVTNSYAVALNYQNSYAQTWTASVQQDLPGRLVAEILYTGIKATHLDMPEAPNQAALGSALTAQERLPIADAGAFTFTTPSGNSEYEAGQIRLTRRLQKGVSANLFYTYSKALDDAVLAQNFYDQAAERGLSTTDRRHVVTANWVLVSPVDATRGFLSHPVWLSKALKDWTLSGSFTAETGLPQSPTIQGNLDGTASLAALRANATGLPVDSGTGYFNTAAFSVPAPGTFGNAGRDTIEGPGMFVMNFSLGRSINLKSEQRRLEFRVDSTNTLNHVNPTGLITVVNSTQFGLITNAATMRQMSATLRLRF